MDRFGIFFNKTLDEAEKELQGMISELENPEEALERPRRSRAAQEDQAGQQQAARVLPLTPFWLAASGASTAPAASGAAATLAASGAATAPVASGAAAAAAQGGAAAAAQGVHQMYLRQAQVAAVEGEAIMSQAFGPGTPKEGTMRMQLQQALVHAVPDEGTAAGPHATYESSSSPCPSSCLLAYRRPRRAKARVLAILKTTSAAREKNIQLVSSAVEPTVFPTFITQAPQFLRSRHARHDAEPGLFRRRQGSRLECLDERPKKGPGAAPQRTATAVKSKAKAKEPDRSQAQTPPPGYVSGPLQVELEEEVTPTAFVEPPRYLDLAFSLSLEGRRSLPAAAQPTAGAPAPSSSLPPSSAPALPLATAGLAGSWEADPDTFLRRLSRAASPQLLSEQRPRLARAACCQLALLPCQPDPADHQVDLNTALPPPGPAEGEGEGRGSQVLQSAPKGEGATPQAAGQHQRREDGDEDDDVEGVVFNRDGCVVFEGGHYCAGPDYIGPPTFKLLRDDDNDDDDDDDDDDNEGQQAAQDPSPAQPLPSTDQQPQLSPAAKPGNTGSRAAASRSGQGFGASSQQQPGASSGQSAAEQGGGPEPGGGSEEEEEEERADAPSATSIVETCLVHPSGRSRRRLKVTASVQHSPDNGEVELQVLRLVLFHELWEGPLQQDPLLAAPPSHPLLHASTPAATHQQLPPGLLPDLLPAAMAASDLPDGEHRTHSATPSRPAAAADRSDCAGSQHLGPQQSSSSSSSSNSSSSSSRSSRVLPSQLEGRWRVITRSATSLEDSSTAQGEEVAVRWLYSLNCDVQRWTVQAMEQAAAQQAGGALWLPGGGPGAGCSSCKGAGMGQGLGPVGGASFSCGCAVVVVVVVAGVVASFRMVDYALEGAGSCAQAEGEQQEGAGGPSRTPGPRGLSMGMSWVLEGGDQVLALERDYDGAGVLRGVRYVTATRPDGLDVSMKD
ncbi:hypothetical protein QJQ45_028665 [Haematococcus lacustris]|nr:hypothetical protein QJQ45_028665 [Haematococcus lacustris]